MAEMEMQQLTEEKKALIAALMRRKGDLSPEEVELAVALVGRAGKLPQMNFKVFQGLFWGDGQIAPLALMEAVFLDRFPLSLEGLKETRVLLTWRKDEYFCGWHHPGKYLGVRESFEGLVQRVAQNEIGSPVNIIGCAGGINNLGLNRDHEVASVCVCWVRPETVDRKDAAFFPVYKLPPDTLGHHCVIHRKALDWLELMLNLPTEQLRSRFRELSMITDCILPK